MRMTVDDCPVNFTHLMALKGTAEGAGGGAAFCKKKHATGWSIQAMNRVQLLAHLIAENLESDLVAALRCLGGMDQLACGLIDRDDPVVFEENCELR